eukprot:COSAG02_NODE_47476_length_340_cov_107.344398_1_plen_49_part_10
MIPTYSGADAHLSNLALRLADCLRCVELGTALGVFVEFGRHGTTARTSA